VEVAVSIAPKLTTTLSTKGQVILPKAIRDRRNWSPGARLTIEETEDGVILRSTPLFPPTRLEDVFGMVKTTGPAKTIEEMDAGILAEARRRHERD
jgi:AbrB family looped-hinge helix DNA binding protein